ncbi:MAG: biotin transporter BioY [Eubacterium sp.]|jgi:biotin transport system substrate-specific component
MSTKAENEKLKKLISASMCAALLCVIGPISIPIGPVPIALTNLALFFLTYVAGTWTTVAACAIYILLGFAGVPVFAGFSGGAHVLLGPTGGFIVGYIPMILVMGPFVTRHPEKRLLCTLVMFGATLVLYTIGTVWFIAVTGSGVWAALAACVLPFAAEDFIKGLAAALAAPGLSRRVKRAVRAGK